MRFKRSFTTIDTHTCGDPTRTVIGGLPYIPGKTISEKMIYLKEHEDWIRKVLMYEPRGVEVQSGVILTEPCTPGTDIGVIYIEIGGYLFMCGHDTIGVATALIETGIIKSTEPTANINLDTPAGVVRVKVSVENSVAKEVTFVNAPAFIFARDIDIKIPDIGHVKVDIGYGGNYYAILEAENVGLQTTPGEAPKIVHVGNMIRNAVNTQIDVYHPEKPFIKGVTHVLFSAPPEGAEATMANAVVIPPGVVCRSPCGTGTCAKLAQLYSQGRLKVGEEFIHQSAMNGTLFKARVIEETKIGEFQAVIPEVTGSAYVTGMHTFLIDPDDPLQEGFRLTR